MILKRQKQLYLASRESDLWKDVCDPILPQGIVLGDTKTPRTVFWPTPEKAVSALGDSVKEGDIVYIYSPLTKPDRDSVYEPKPHESPLYQGLGEVWFLTNTRLSKPDSVLLGKVVKEKILTYYNPRRHDFRWREWILKPVSQQVMQSKAFLLVSLDKGESLKAQAGTKFEISLKEAAERVKPGTYYIYKPLTQKIPLLVPSLECQGDVELKRSGRIQILDKSGNYKTL